jgi:hypothetical protein
MNTSQTQPTIEAKVGECTVILKFADEKNPNLKNDVLRQLTQCYEDRVVAKSDN